LKTVKSITLRYTDADGQEWGMTAAIELPTIGSPETVQDYAIKRLVQSFDEWRRGL